MPASRIVNLFSALIVVCTLHSQSSCLRVSFERFGNPKTYEIFTYEILHYKMKGDVFYRKNKIVNMRDSIIVFDNDSILHLNEIKAILLNKNIAEVRMLRTFFYATGIAFFTLNTVNNALIGTEPVLDGVAASISAGLIGTGFLIKQLEIRRIKMGKGKTLKVIPISYQNLSHSN